jgi:hypothetical protein
MDASALAHTETHTHALLSDVLGGSVIEADDGVRGINLAAEAAALHVPVVSHQRARANCSGPDRWIPANRCPPCEQRRARHRASHSGQGSASQRQGTDRRHGRSDSQDGARPLDHVPTHVGERSRSICTQEWPRQPLFTSLLASASAARTSAGMDMAARVSSTVFVSVGTARLCVCVCEMGLSFVNGGSSIRTDKLSYHAKWTVISPR